MTIRPTALLLLLMMSSAVAQDGAAVPDRHAAWRSCLQRNFALQAAIASRIIAADAALRTCRQSEQAYLAALSVSPLVDGDDVARVRPALLLRAKDWLLDGGRQRPL
ncbi:MULTISPECIES: hypothetical protein [unclassified Methylobacterium]|uniref:hypothetical protein n=1 Tax=unclassified Methylobacterium TaxID=2615210 RepID=UPI0006FAEF05|nr:MULTISPECIES: hypothetical protein [unclassified Methylobacterium]KQP88280.1 hypothetical protein ASF57_08825 [Methylobacterium sp. Leaf117]KQP94894.1 hypothetical protein ASF60_01515 [Methylobacterium sp. Leaf113]MCK2053497.1 hypothetical protein [Methylobacterium sp. 37f]